MNRYWLAPAVLALLSSSATAGDIKLTFTGTVTMSMGTLPAPFQSASAGEPITMIFEVFNTPTGPTPQAATYPCDFTVTTVQVGSTTSPVVTNGMDCLTVMFDIPPLGSDSLLARGNLPGGTSTVEAAFTDGLGMSSLMGFLDMNFGSFPAMVPILGFMNIVQQSPIGAISADMNLMVIEAVGNPPVGTNYCTSTSNSLGFPALISTTGTASVAANDLGFRAGPVMVGQPAIFYYGPSQIQAPFGDGFRCVGGGAGQVIRVFPFILPDGGGFLNGSLDNTLAAHSQVTPGNTLNFQAWYRDPVANMSGFNLSDGISVVFLP